MAPPKPKQINIALCNIVNQYKFARCEIFKRCIEFYYTKSVSADLELLNFQCGLYMKPTLLNYTKLCAKIENFY
jgi:hypothetical protein